MLMANKDTNTPYIYFIEKENDFYWISQAYLESCQVDWHKENIEDLVMRLGKIHAYYYQSKHAFNAFKKWQYPSKESLMSLVDTDLNMDHLKIIFKSYDILNKSYKTFIHGDMIPLNMIVTEEGVKIIDWEHSCIGPYVLDLGRLLADYNVDQPWINPEWETHLLKTYHKTLNDKGLIISYDQMFLEYQCARLNNYFGIVRAFKTHQWQRNAWYDLNLGKMLETIRKVEGLIAL
jgi:thiamine kinase-like enzyme